MFRLSVSIRRASLPQLDSNVTGISFAFTNVVFRCGHRNAGMFTEDQSGIIGLGGGPFSLITQMGSSINGKFSYCLVQMFSHVERSSKMYFGITVGGQRIDFYTTKPTLVEGNIIIESGTSLTLLPESFYNRVQSTVTRSMPDILPVHSDPQNNLRLCYNPLEVKDLPVMVAHFNGADLELDPINTFVQLSKDSICLAFAPVDGVVIFGNLAQMNFLVGYDLYKKTISFKHTDCVKL
ncbi:putative nepenthesin [Helianthus anomalus]